MFCNYWEYEVNLNNRISFRCSHEKLTIMYLGIFYPNVFFRMETVINVIAEI